MSIKAPLYEATPREIELEKILKNHVFGGYNRDDSIIDLHREWRDLVAKRWDGKPYWWVQPVPGRENG